MHTSIDEFIEEWLSEHKTSPEIWPLDLTEGMWLDNFEIWLNTSKINKK